MARPTKSSNNRPGWAQRLETTRVRTGLNMGEFATAIGLREETYRRYERGETEPNINTLSRIRQLTSINLNFLVAGEPDLVVNQPNQPTPKAKRQA